ncbi:MAG: ATP-dependent helicase [Acidimicrobiales bacterium]|nr:MAG: ATP-dependent helicase [Acidimicrobiales bacterium]
MAEAMSEAISSGTHLLVQAGTGTGKSLGYLVPALHSGKRIVVATATLALQAQLIEHDLPRLLSALAPHLRHKPSFAVLKGRGNYACLAKLEGSAESDSLFDSGQQWLGELSRLEQQLGRIREWSQQTPTGDRTDLDPGVEDAMWRRVSVTARECVGAQRCAFGDECFAERAKAQARQVDVIVTNHALLALDMLHDRSVLPPHDILIVDEAHELPGHVTNVARAELRPDALRQLVRRVSSRLSADAVDKLEEAENAADGALASAPSGRLIQLPQQLSAALTMLAGAASSAATTLAANADSGDDTASVAAHQDLQQIRELAEITQRMAEGAEHDVVWVNVDDRERRTLAIAPLSVIPQLGTHLFTDRTVVATSATLTLGGKFDGVARGFGLALPEAPQWHGIDVGSPFNYREQGILYVAAKLPRLTSSGLPDVARQELLELVRAAGGRTLGLFSSRKAAAAAAEAIRAETELPVLVQGEDSLSHLVRQFREVPESCLFGVLSLWQGVDVPGSACQLVVIDRLPFPRPDDPLPAARSAAADAGGGSGFGSVFVPHAAVRLAQGAGRLIRSGTDRGVVAVLDSRLHHASYGTYLRRSLPGFWYTTSAEAVRAALGRLDTAARAGV